MNGILSFLTIWGVWILVPIIVDGVYALIHWVYAITSRSWLGKKHTVPEEDLPLVSVLIPTYNEEKNIDLCLNSLKIQDYPHAKMEIIVIDDGSTDSTKELVVNHISELNGNGYVNGQKYKDRNGTNGDTSTTKNGNGTISLNGKTYDANGFLGKIRLHTNGHKGKAFALNAGICESRGEIIFNIDSDVALAPDAIRNAVYAFLEDPDLGAVTGNIEISFDQGAERTEPERAAAAAEKVSFNRSFLGNSQFLEYLSAFRLGRQFQSHTNSLYTLAGAFSGFRAKYLFKSTLYRQKSVSEDTDLTFDLHNNDVRIGYVSDAKAYVQPCLSWDSLYAQRVRWARGQLEVGSLHREAMKKERFDFFRKITFPMTLAFDHTFSFLRAIWVLLLPLFFLFDYPPRVILAAVFLMYLFYITVDIINTGACYFISDKDTKKLVRTSFYWCCVLPVFRFITFYFRMAGYLMALTEPAEWRVPGMGSDFKNGVNGVKNGVNGVKNGVKNGINGVKNGVTNGVKNGFVNGLKNGLTNFFSFFG